MNRLENPNRAKSYILDSLGESESEDLTEELTQACREMKEEMDEFGTQDNTIQRQNTFYQLYQDKEKLKKMIRKNRQRNADMFFEKANQMADQLKLNDPKDRAFVFEKYDSELARTDAVEKLKIQRLMKQMEIDDIDEEQRQDFLEKDYDEEKTKEKWLRMKSRG